MDKGRSFFFDKQDYDLVELIDELVAKDQNPARLRRLFDTHLHPRGIKELAASRERRIAYAVARLLHSLDTGLADERLLALRALRDELIEGGDQALLLNSGRALLETMKHLVRERSHSRRLELAHDFFSVVSGRPRNVRRQLGSYHLLEMSERWNQLAFDHHVHDANTKGRKAPTHLIVDAWIKGIREMAVIYYFFVAPEAIAELVEAAEVMGLAVQPGIEVWARYRGKYVQLIWTPRGLSNAREYLELLASPGTQAFFEQGREVVDYHTRRLLALLDSFNRHHLAQLNAEYEIELEPLLAEDFLRHVGVGQPSRSHLADFLHQKVVEHVEARLPALREKWKTSDAAARTALDERLKRLDALTPEDLGYVYLSEEANPGVPNGRLPRDDAPPLLRLSPSEMVARLNSLRASSHITLNPSNLSPAEVLEILFECQGSITHIETFNLKDYTRGQNRWMREIDRIRRVLNSRNPITCKRMIQDVIRQVESSDRAPSEKEADLASLRHLLGHMSELLSHYAHAPLGARLGSDSTGRARNWAGMGLAVMPSLPRRAIRSFEKHPGTGSVVPVRTEIAMRSTWVPRHSHLRVVEGALGLARRLPLPRAFGYRRADDFVELDEAIHIADEGNVLTLGGVPENRGNGLALDTPADEAPERRSWRQLNSNVKNAAKILIGLIPAFLSFRLTNDWWFLAWYGAFIWFGIAGVRNIIQSVVGGAGLVRSDLLRWTDMVSWGRFADDLMFTGLSVPLLDWLVKEVALGSGLGVTAATAPWLLYVGVGSANGIYNFCHNLFRGLPTQAAVGNLLRPVVAIPLAILMNAAILHVLLASNVDLAHANMLLEASAAVIQKLSLDTLKGFVEGIADRNVNLARRHKDFASKLARLLQVHGRLEALFPNLDVVETLAAPKQFFNTVGKEALGLEKQQIINALDLMYLWMYQPRARVVFEQQLASRSPEERRIILRTQRLLERKRPISEMFIDDLVGKNFSPPLAFYLEQSASYLRDMRRLARKYEVDWERSVSLEPARTVATERESPRLASSPAVGSPVAEPEDGPPARA